MFLFFLFVSWSQAEPRNKKHRARKGEMLLLLLAGPTLLRQREGDISANDSGAGRGKRRPGKLE